MTIPMFCQKLKSPALNMSHSPTNSSHINAITMLAYTIHDGGTVFVDFPFKNHHSFQTIYTNCFLVRCTHTLLLIGIVNPRITPWKSVYNLINSCSNCSVARSCIFVSNRLHQSFDFNQSKETSNILACRRSYWQAEKEGGHARERLLRRDCPAMGRYAANLFF